MAHYLELDGEKVSLCEYCRRKGLKYTTVCSKIYRNNMTPEQAVHYCETFKNSSVTSHSTKLKYLVEYNGEIISLFKYCKLVNLNYNAIIGRINKFNISVKDAITYCMKHTPRSRRLKGNVKNRNFYKIWHNTVSKCTNPSHRNYNFYHNLGIQESWLDFDNFQNDMYEEYLEYVNTYGDIPSLDRINNNVGYFKENCHWIPLSRQARNKKETIRTNSGEPLLDYCERKGLRYSVIYSRLQAGYTLEEAEAMPIPTYTGKYLDYIGKNVREFNVIQLSELIYSDAVGICNICGKKSNINIYRLLGNLKYGGCSCRKGEKLYIGINNYSLKELDTIYNYTHKQIKEAIANNDMSLFSNIVNLTNEEWIELLKDIHSKW